MKITLIGAGNAGFHLAKRLKEKGFQLEQIFSRDLSKAQTLASEVGARAVDQLSAIVPHEGLYLLAVRDDAIASVAYDLSEAGVQKGLFVHTSGATPASILQPYFERFGIFYPLQTFSIQRAINFSEIPICIHANEIADVNLLQNLAQQLGSQAVHIQEEQRIALHVAAVFVNNFSNYLFQAGQRILEKEQLDFKLLLPLIRETAEKVRHLSPSDAQTGPAIRGDAYTIARHLDYLENAPDDAALYALMTKLIAKSRQVKD